jgi:hypothetical protein
VVLGQEDVQRLDVAVDDLIAMNVVDRFSQLERNRPDQRLVNREIGALRFQVLM